MFKIRMQGQYGRGGKRLSGVVGEMWRTWGLRDGVMRGYWVSNRLILVGVTGTVMRADAFVILGHGDSRNTGVRGVLCW